MQTIKDVEINALKRIYPNKDIPERYMPYTYLMIEDLDKWTQSHDGGKHYGAMTTNISKCFNGYLKVLAICPLLQWLSLLGANLLHFHDRHKEITSDLSQGKVWSDYAMGIYIENVHKASGFTIRAFNHEGGIYQVLTLYNDYRGGGGNHSHEINILGRTCGCGKWQNIKIPCSHAIKVF